MFNQLVTSFTNNIITYCCKLHGCLACLNQLTAKVTSELDSKKLEEIMKNHSLLIQPINVLSAKILDLLTSHTTFENSLNDITKSVKSQRNSATTNTLSSTFVAINAVDEMSERDKRKSTQSS